MFDAHHDALEPACLDRIRSLRAGGFSTGDVIELCRQDLRQLDDDWLRAGMHLGLIGDAVVFGVENHFNEFPMDFTDKSGCAHRIELLELPGHGLGYQGSLSDLAKSYAYDRAWEILGWEYRNGGGFWFRPEPKLVLDFDLDCFAINWRDYTLPWPEEVFRGEFLEVSTYFSTAGLNGQQFVRGLVEKAGLITIASKPDHCGGERKASEILAMLIHYVLGEGEPNVSGSIV
jgi:uncharacterized protein YoaH (UPF0181 family)